MRFIALPALSPESAIRFWLRLLCLTGLLWGGNVLSADVVRSKEDTSEASRTAASGADVIHSTKPMAIETAGTEVHGQLAVASEILSADSRTDLIYTITVEPIHGRVGLAGGDDEADFFKTTTSRLGYFAYRPQEDYA